MKARVRDLSQDSLTHSLRAFSLGAEHMPAGSPSYLPMCSLHENVHICKCLLEQPWSVLLQLYYTLAGAIHALIFGGSLGGVVQIRPGPIECLMSLIALLDVHIGP